MIIGRQSGLGRGLGALIPPKPAVSAGGASSLADALPPELRSTSLDDTSAAASGQQVVLPIPVSSIERNPHQPRVHFDHAQLEDLIASIKEHGILQPLVVSPLGGNRYQLIAGERRLRSATIAGLETVPAIVRDATEQQKLELAIIENVQRQDLNPIEEARAYRRLMDEFNLTQDEVSEKMGKSRPQVANMVRLLQLPETIQQALIERKINASNARTLLSLATDAERMELFQAMLAGNFTVRQTEARIPHPRRAARPKDPNVAEAESALREVFHCRVEIKRDLSGEGEIRLKFHTDEEYAATVKKLKGESQ
jgi:ParB family transcriptional regulator, chromosome partitioning protein